MISMAAISLLALCAVIFVSYKLNVNAGVLAIAAAFILGFFIVLPNGPPLPISSAATKAKAILSGWNSNLFLVIAAVTLLFSIARANGTLAILSSKAVGLVRGNTALLPIMMYLVSFVLGGIGPGTIGATTLLVPMAAAIAIEEGVSVLLMCAAVWAGVSGAMSSVTPTGIIGINLANAQGVNLGEHLLFNCAIGLFVMFALLYILTGAWRPVKKDPQKTAIRTTQSLTADNWMTIVIVLAMVVSAVFFKLDNGLVAFVGSAILLAFGKVDEKAAFGGVPWATIMMVCGVGMLINVIDIAGGIKLLTSAMAPYTSSSTASAIMTLSAGAMSAVASASGVVMPTLIPAAKSLAIDIGIDPAPLMIAVVYGAHLTAISPFSTGGALTLASAGEAVDKLKLFNQLLALAVGAVLTGSLLTAFHVVGYL